MTENLPRSLIAVFALICAPISGQAQDPLVDQQNTHDTTKIEARLEKKYTVKIELDAPPSKRCQAHLEIEYLQKGAEARVDSSLGNNDCAASSGSYTISVRYRDAGGESHTIEFDETWQRDDDQPILASKDYFVGNDVDITRIRSKSLQCICAEAPVENDAQ